MSRRQRSSSAVDRSRRESVAAFWLMRESFERQDFATAVQHADVLLRTRPQVALLVAPTLARIAEDNSASPELMAHARDQSAMASGILLHADAQHHGCAHAA